METICKNYYNTHYIYDKFEKIEFYSTGITEKTSDRIVHALISHQATITEGKSLFKRMNKTF